jgi:hypothetical protein
MIHVIQHHIGKGSYTAWYDIIKFEDPATYHHFGIKEDVEQKKYGEPPYIDLFEKLVKDINPQKGDYIFADSKYVCHRPIETDEYLTNLSKKHNNCKFVLFEDDNSFKYTDNEHFLYFSNIFTFMDKEQNHKFNCNYYRYRTVLQDYYPHLDWFVNQFRLNVRQKKMNMIIGADKKHRLQVFRYCYRIGLDKDSWMGYSAFSRQYNDSDLSDDLIQFRNENIPVILDTLYEDSCRGSVNVEIPPLPITSTSYISCICETMILTEDQIHLSEKSFNPFLSKNIPLILGSAKINEYLKSEGFWLAEDLFDLTPQRGFDAIINQYIKNLDVINNMSFEDLHNYYLKNGNNIDSNYHKLKSDFVFKASNYKRPL